MLILYAPRGAAVDRNYLFVFKYCFMEFTSTVLYNQELSYYHVATSDGQTFKARLLSDTGSLSALPPKEVVLQRKDGQWECSGDEAVLHFLRFDIDRKLREREYAL